MTKTNELATTTERVELTSPQKTMAFANGLKDLIVNNNLYTKIQGKNYINVEGWQIVGMFTGVMPVVEKVENLSEGKEFKYRAEASLRDSNGNIVGGGMAICTNSEPGKRGFAEYAVASMAQTRAVAKAYRLKFGCLLKIAGYETTPSEEMDVQNGVEVKSDDEKHDIEVKAAIVKLRMSKDMDELRSNFASLSRSMTLDEQVVAAKDVLKKQFGDENE